MVAKSALKFIKSLHQKKYRMRHGLFLAEGVKLVTDLLHAGWPSHTLYATEPVEGIPDALPITPDELRRVSTLVNPNKVVGIFEIPKTEAPQMNGWLLALDGVRDPGNLGTIIRLCDWFGIRHILCSPDTVDCFNPKVLMATMGSIARVRLHYGPLEENLTESGLPLIGASMEGTGVARYEFPEEGILLMGSESHGISPGLREHLTATLSIPASRNSGAESLNVGTATAILLYELRRDNPATQK
jgi:TrmH family RNA methyltransferase